MKPQPVATNSSKTFVCPKGYAAVIKSFCELSLAQYHHHYPHCHFPYPYHHLRLSPKAALVAYGVNLSFPLHLQYPIPAIMNINKRIVYIEEKNILVVESSTFTYIIFSYAFGRKIMNSILFNNDAFDYTGGIRFIESLCRIKLFD